MVGPINTPIINDGISRDGIRIMLSYRHGFHAGNFADVHKHIVLTLLLQALRRKDSPFCVIDTHAGAGRYDLDSAAAEKNREYTTGIGRVWQQSPVPETMDSYLQTIRAINGSDEVPVPQYYPGSPFFEQHLLRPQDRLVLCELHNSEYPLLKNYFRHDRRVSVQHQDGYDALKALLPPRERRGLVLIDPAYELKDEYTRCLTALMNACQRWPTGIFACWYPVQADNRCRTLLRGIEASGIRKVLLAEFNLAVRGYGKSMIGTGMMIINPPWQLEQQLAGIHDWLLPVLADPGAGSARVDWLVPE
jgi:23S rRNA (adenine2030-N6)-methyltransferase